MLRRIFNKLAFGNFARKDSGEAEGSCVVDEHFVPKLGLNPESYITHGDVAGVHHLTRYKWAIEVLVDEQPLETLLDVACGSGYGSYLIAKRFPLTTVVGVDYDPAAVQAAANTYSLPNLKYQTGDVTDWENTIGTDRYRCIISFDTIEHVSHREIMMENLVESLEGNGFLLLSTPCGAEKNNLCPQWEYHKFEYSAASLYDFLKRYFSTVIRPEDPAFPHLEIFKSLDASDIPYLLRLNPLICKGPILIKNPYKA
jgi:SAM-dependent methyltransferase